MGNKKALPLSALLWMIHELPLIASLLSPLIIMTIIKLAVTKIFSA